MTRSQPLRFGLVGVDSPHATQFTDLLGDGVTGEVAGATVTHAWKGVAAQDFPLSRDRIDGFAVDVAERGVTMCGSPEEVASAVDALLVVSSDVRTHPGYFARVATAGKPVYVDTRFALTRAAAADMLALAREHGCLPLAGSPKRFTPEFLHARAVGDVTDADLHGPLPTQPGHPVLDWYGFHLADLAVAALGPDVASVDATDDDAVRVTWSGGGTALLRGSTEWSPTTHGVLRGPGADPRTFTIEAGAPMLTGLLSAIISAVRTGVPLVSDDQILATVGLVEAARTSRDHRQVVLGA